MRLLSWILIGIVAIEHLYFLYLEMFAWTKPATRRAFGTTAEFAEASKALAANQGLYNGFLAAGLAWSLLRSIDAFVMYPNAVQCVLQGNLRRMLLIPENDSFALQLNIFFLGCVIVAAIYGGLSVNRRILIVQGLPAMLALAATLYVG